MLTATLFHLSHFQLAKTSIHPLGHYPKLLQVFNAQILCIFSLPKS